MKKFKLVTLLGIRPDIIRMHKLIRMLDEGQDQHNYRHIFVHSGQHFDYELDKVFYEELRVRHPDINLALGADLKAEGRTGPAHQAARLFARVDQLIDEIKPDAILYLGDTNTTASSLVAAVKNVPVIHIEAGGRSFDWRMPEEKNRLTIDHMSDALYVYLDRYQEILLHEGIAPSRITVVGNIITDAIKEFNLLAGQRKAAEKLGVKKAPYALCTLHRQENVDDKDVLVRKTKDLIRLARELTVVWPVMPRARKKLEEYNLLPALQKSEIIRTKPLGFLDFMNLEQNAKLIVTDSGTVQEEALIMGVPCLVIRRSTERPETIEAGATVMSDTDLYSHALAAMNMETGWDRSVLNPGGGSPSERIYHDLMSKISDGFFGQSRDYEFLKDNPFVPECYGKK